MIFKNCPECKGKGYDYSSTSVGEVTFDRCKLCKERTLYKRQFDQTMKANHDSQTK